MKNNGKKWTYGSYQELKNIFSKLIVALDDDMDENQYIIKQLI